MVKIRGGPQSAVKQRTFMKQKQIYSDYFLFIFHHDAVYTTLLRTSFVYIHHQLFSFLFIFQSLCSNFEGLIRPRGQALTKPKTPAGIPQESHFSLSSVSQGKKN